MATPAGHHPALGRRPRRDPRVSGHARLLEGRSRSSNLTRRGRSVRGAGRADRAALGERFSTRARRLHERAGLPAKPIIDIDVTVADSRDEAAYVPALEAVGFPLRSASPAGTSTAASSPRRRGNMHVCSPDCPEAIRHRMFRDWLRDHPDDRARYAGEAGVGRRVERGWRGGDGLQPAQAAGDPRHPRPDVPGPRPLKSDRRCGSDTATIASATASGASIGDERRHVRRPRPARRRRNAAARRRPVCQREAAVGGAPHDATGRSKSRRRGAAATRRGGRGRGRSGRCRARMRRSVMAGVIQWRVSSASRGRRSSRP